MIILVSLCITLSYSLFLLSKKNKFYFPITVKLSIVAIICMCGLIYLSKNTQYSTPFSIDYRFFIFLSQQKISVTLLSRFYNICFALIMLSSVYSLHKILSLKRSIFVFIALIPIVFFLYATDYTTTYKIYVDVNDINPSKYAIFLSQFGNTLCKVILFSYIVIPYIFLIKNVLKSRIYTRRKHLSTVIAACGLLDVYTLYVLCFSIFKHISFYNVNFAKLPPALNYTPYSYTSVALSFLLVFAAITLLLYKINPFSLFSIKSNKETVSIAKMFNKNLGMQLHMYKNAFISAGQQFYLISTQLESKKYDIAYDLSKKAIDITQEYVDTIENNLKLLSVVSEKFYDVNIIDCLRIALLDISKKDKIEIHMEYEVNNAIVLGNKYYLTEAFRNLFMNSLDAIKEAQRHGSIKINLLSEPDFYMLEITDNGIGIENTKNNNIFEPFYSTKINNRGNGIGLAYVKNVISAHNGEIRFNSIPGEYTTFQITFPKRKIISPNRNRFLKVLKKGLS